MTSQIELIEKTIEQILSSDDFVVSEVKKIQYLYMLKSEIRYNQKRQESIRTESVAEHTFGIHILADYFAPLEDENGDINMQRVHKMISFHDADEIVTGDVISQLKLDNDESTEMEAIKEAVLRIPTHMQSEVLALMEEYHAQQTLEAKFVKALDKVEPVFEMYQDDYKSILRQNKTTQEHNDRTKVPYVKDFPIMQRFCRVMSNRMKEEGYFFE